MDVFDLKNMAVYPFQERDRNVLFRSEDFTARIIPLPARGAVPPCEMASSVIFTVVSGKMTVVVNGGESALEEGWCRISGPATLSMHTVEGARVLGIQVPRGGIHE